MNIWKTLFISLLIMGIVGSTYTVEAFERQQDRPNGAVVALDAVPVRIIGVAVTIVGGAVFVVSLPFTIFTDVETAWDSLVVDPYLFTFHRPLGQFHNWRTRMEESEKMNEPEEKAQAQME